jgi:hypothetical protein
LQATASAKADMRARVEHVVKTAAGCDRRAPSSWRRTSEARSS